MLYIRKRCRKYMIFNYIKRYSKNLRIYRCIPNHMYIIYIIIYKTTIPTNIYIYLL